MDEWTNLKPTEAGYYWRYIPGERRSYMTALTKKTEAFGAASMVCESSDCRSESGWSFAAIAEPPTSADEIEQETLWHGPILAPPLPPDHQ